MNREQQAAYSRAWYASHREQHRERNRAWYARHREEKAAYYVSHRDQRLAYGRDYYTIRREQRRRLRQGEVPVRCHACGSILTTLRLQDWDRYQPPDFCPHCGWRTQTPVLVQRPVPCTNHVYLSEAEVRR